MSDEDLARLEEYARAAVSGPWRLARTPATSRLAVLWWVARLLWRGRGPAWGVVLGDDEDAPTWVALTGNGAASEVDAAYLVAAQPANLLLLVTEVRRLRAEVPS